MQKKFDIVIIGAGPAGLCFARALSGQGLQVALIEKQPLSAIADPAYDGREIALTHSSHAIMQELGIWDKIPPAKVHKMLAAEVENGDSPYALHFDASGTGVTNLGFMVSNQSIRAAAYRACEGLEGLHFMTEQEVCGVKTGPDGASVTLEDGRTIEAALVVAADSRFSPARKLMGIKTEMRDLKRTCIVCTAESDKDHDKTARELFLYGQTLAVLPLDGRRVSLVVTCSSDKAEKILAAPEKLGADLTEKTEGKYGRFGIDSRLFSYPLFTTYADKFYAQRFALVGDAAVGMHPVTAHGFNLGLKGGYTLAQEIRHFMGLGFDAGYAQALVNYDRKHQKICRPLYMGTNFLVELYTAESKPARLMRHGLLRLGGRLMLAKNLIVRQLTDAG